MAADQVLYSGAVDGVEVKVVGSSRPFKRSDHRTTELVNAGTQTEPKWRSATVDGAPVVGTDRTIPKDGVPQLASLSVWFGPKRVEVPPRFLNHVFLPHLKPAVFSGHQVIARAASPRFIAQMGPLVSNLVTFSADGEAVFISLGVGTSGSAGSYDFFVTRKGEVTVGGPVRLEP